MGINIAIFFTQEIWLHKHGKQTLNNNRLSIINRKRDQTVYLIAKHTALYK